MKHDRDNINNSDLDANKGLQRMLADLWCERRFIIKFTVVSLLVGLVVAISIPKEYDTTVSLAPEISGKRAASSGLAGFAAAAGLNFGQYMDEALSPNLYPEIIGSTPFLLELSRIEVTETKNNTTLSLADYIKNDTKMSWWNYIMMIPGKAVSGMISLFREKPSEIPAPEDGGYFMLSREQSAILNGIKSRLSVKLDSKSGIAFITVRMQDPLVSAVIADSVLTKLQNYITRYRTEKSKSDYIFMEQLHQEAKLEYLEAQRRYAAYVDRNKNVILQAYRSEEEQLRNEMNLTFGIYNQLAQNLSMAKAKIQEITPVFTIVQPSTVPVRAASPRKMLIMLAFAFLGAAFAAGWVLFFKDILSEIKSASKQSEEDTGADCPADE